MWLLPVSIALLTIGLLAVVLGLRGRRVGTAPHCRACGFELSGLVGMADRCPECGASIGTGEGERAVARGARRRRPVVAAVGAMLFVAGASGVVSALTAMGPAIIRSLPSGVLIGMADRGNGIALEEITERLIDGELDAAETSRLADAALAKQADRTVPFNPDWADVLETLRASGSMSATQVELHFRNALATQIFVRSMVRQGTDVPVKVAWGDVRMSRHAPPLQLVTEITKLRIGTSHMHKADSTVSTWILKPGGWANIHPVKSASVTELDLGLAECEVTLHVKLLDASGMSPWLEWDIEHIQDIEVVASDAPIVTIADDTAPRSEVIATLGILGVDVLAGAPKRESDIVIGVRFGAEGCPVDLGYKVEVLLADARRIPIGSLAKPKHKHLIQSQVQITAGVLIAAGIDPAQVIEWPDTVDVVLTPDPEAVYHQPAITEIFGGTLVFRAVPVVRHEDLDSWSSDHTDPIFHAEP